MEPANDALICACAQLLIDSRDTPEFEGSEQMLYTMLVRRQTERNIKNLKKIEQGYRQ